MREVRYCEKHGDAMFIRYKGSNGKYYWNCTECKSEVSRKRARGNKLKAVQYLGGSCSVCRESFEGRQEVFDFHHVDPLTKATTVNKLMQNGWEVIVKELDKCVLVCANCHRTIHVDLRNK